MPSISYDRARAASQLLDDRPMFSFSHETHAFSSANACSVETFASSIYTSVDTFKATRKIIVEPLCSVKIFIAIDHLICARSLIFSSRFFSKKSSTDFNI